MTLQCYRFRYGSILRVVQELDGSYSDIILGLLLPDEERQVALRELERFQNQNLWQLSVKDFAKIEERSNDQQIFLLRLCFYSPNGRSSKRSHLLLFRFSLINDIYHT